MIKRLVNMKTMALYDIHSKFFNELNDTNDNDNDGDFISTRYPTLLAEPDSEIYETAVADYGVYASPAVYGNGDITGDDYVLYSSTDDYMMLPSCCSSLICQKNIKLY